MSTPDRISSTGMITLKSETIENNIRGGNSYTRIFTGSFHLIATQRLIELGAGASMVKAESTGDGNYELTSTYPWDVINGSNAEPAPNTHELEVGMESVPSYITGVCYNQLLAAFGSYAGANGARAFLNARVNKWNSSNQEASDIVDIELEFSSTYGGATLALMLNLFRGVAYHGMTNGTQYNTVYRRKIQAASWNQVQGSFTGAGMIWTTAEMTAFEGTPPAQWFNLPANYLWKKTGPRVLTIANQKTEVSYEYIADLQFWSGNNVAYGSALLITF